MAKGRKQAKAASKRKKREDELPSELQDEVDVFHKGREKISLDPADTETSDESLADEDEAGVYDLDSGEGSGEEEVEDGHLANLARQERLLRSKLQLQQGGGSDIDEEEGQEEKMGKWGAKKKAYYEDKELDEEEALKEEEEEALALQKEAAEALDQEDFGAESSDRESAEDDADTLGQQLEAVTVAREAPSDSQTVAIQKDAPELEILLETLKSSLGEVRLRIGPLVREVREGHLVTAEGVSYLETKNALLLHYCLNLVFYLLLKAEGKSVQQHPVVSRLVEIRAFLEKIRPIDKKLRYQIEKLLTSHQLVQAANGGMEDIDPLHFRPNPEALVPKVANDTSDGGGDGGVYRPPKLNPVAMEDDPDKDSHRREKRAAADRARKSARSQLVQELAREVRDAPEELREVQAGEDGRLAAEQRARLDRRAAEEEDLMMRVPLTKKDLKGLKSARRAGMSGGALLDDFADDVADILQATAGLQTGNSLSQRFGADLAPVADLAGRSGDAELPTKASLAERRAKLDHRKAGKTSATDLERLLAEPASKRQRNDLSDDDIEEYKEAQRLALNKKAAKKAKYSAGQLPPPLEDEMVEGARKLTSAVEKNRGLTPHRRKDTKNPRVKGRKKFEKATIRRKGQVSDVRKPAGPYGGEETGIKARVSKSRRL